MPAAVKPATATLWEKFLQMDLIGTVIIVAATACYLLALQWGGTTKPWHSPDVIVTLILFVLLTVLFVLIEIWQGERALLIPRILKGRTVAAGCIFVFL
jgi:MFS transporter, DHA2 family, glioxin efflux transporter